MAEGNLWLFCHWQKRTSIRTCRSWLGELHGKQEVAALFSHGQIIASLRNHSHYIATLLIFIADSSCVLVSVWYKRRKQNRRWMTSCTRWASRWPVDVTMLILIVCYAVRTGKATRWQHFCRRKRHQLVYQASITCTYMLVSFCSLFPLFPSFFPLFRGLEGRRFTFVISVTVSADTGERVAEKCLI